MEFPSEIEKASKVFSVLASETRLRLLYMMAYGVNDRRELAREVGISNQAFIRQVRELHLAGMINHKRTGQYVEYTVRDTVWPLLEPVGLRQDQAKTAVA